MGLQMNVTRRTVLAALASAASLNLKVPSAAPVEGSGFSAALFDGFAIFDPRPVFARTSKLFAPDVGQQLVETWRMRQFEYQWLHALGDDYVDFHRATEEALVFAARQHQIPMPDTLRKQIMEGFQELTVWPDVPAGLEALRKEIPRLGLLSNMTPAMLESGIRRAGLASAFDYVLSTDAARTFKPAPRAYALGTSATGLRRQSILFVAFAGWDAAGARHFGYPTFWLNRQGAEAEELGQKADGAGREFRDIVEFASRRT